MTKFYRDITNEDCASEVEVALQWRGTRSELPEEIRDASRKDIKEYLMKKYDGRKEYAIEEEGFLVIDVMAYAEDDEDYERGVSFICPDKAFIKSPEAGVIEYWCRHESNLCGEVVVDEKGDIIDEDLGTGKKYYCVEEVVFFGSDV